MKNEPNGYRVEYQVMEGNNYAGGWVTRYCDIVDLGDVKRYSNVKSVRPIFIEIGDALDNCIIQKAKIKKREQEDKEKRDYEIKRTQEKLDKLRQQN